MNQIKNIILFTAVAILPAFSQINDLVKTPPMGWNSWNVFHENINENQIKEIADVMVSSGMKDAGYIYLNLDDNWMAKTRNANGDLQADPTRFPSGMKALGDYIHEKGLKFGIYGDRGLRTCHHYNNSSQFPNSGSGSYMKEERDAKTFASWGVDYLKYDNCEPAPGSNQRQDYERMRDALLKSGRDIVFSICAWGYQDWMPKTGNLWRTTGDISNAWEAKPGDWFRGVADIIEENEKWYSMTKRSGEGANIKLEIVNQSGVDRMQYSWTDTVEVPSVPQEPFGSFNGELEIAGEPTSIPGTIEVENFDLGGNQVSFYD
ncbi:MAG TPA: alpha-galactosidase, partial [Sediminibacterium sp.]|nr:alpha-galactosidase [Sediminibacterium sp.]